MNLNRELPQLTINFEAFGSALAAGALDSCLAYLTRAHRNSESDTGPNCSLAEALFHRGRRDEAVECCRRAVPGLGSDTAMLRICAWVFSNCRCHDEAIAAYRRLIELCPEGIEFHRHASGSLAAIGRIDEAIADGEKASDLALQNPEFALHVGVLLLNARRYAEATGYLGRAVALEPDNAHALCELAAACHALGDSDEALALALRAAALIRGDTPGDRSIAIHAAELLMRCGWTDEAAELLHSVATAAGASAGDPRLSGCCPPRR